MSTIHQYLWTEVARLDFGVMDIILDELVRTATNSGIGTQRCEIISHIIGTLSLIHIRVRIYLRLRKVHHRTG